MVKIILYLSFDPRVLVWESYAVAKAAIETGVARLKNKLR